jgi:hypothetical protein
MNRPVGRLRRRMLLQRQKYLHKYFRFFDVKTPTLIFTLFSKQNNLISAKSPKNTNLITLFFSHTKTQSHEGIKFPSGGGEFSWETPT